MTLNSVPRPRHTQPAQLPHLGAHRAVRRTIHTAAGRILPQLTSLARTPANLVHHLSDLQGAAQ